jgi:hypothetical protein
VGTAEEEKKQRIEERKKRKKNIERDMETEHSQTTG